VAFDGRESVQLLGVSSSALLRSGSVPNNKEIQSGAVSKSYMRKSFLLYEEMRKYFPIYEEAISHIQYDFATAPF
jgi:hypothetical protein